MRVKDMNMSFGVSKSLPRIILRINDQYLTTIYWGRQTSFVSVSPFTRKSQAIAFVNLLCDRFNAGQK